MPNPTINRDHHVNYEIYDDIFNIDQKPIVDSTATCILWNVYIE